MCSEQKGDPENQRLLDEMKEFGDIVRLDVVDSYDDLSRKTLKMLSVLPEKIDASFYFKVDDDVAVNIDALEIYLSGQRNQGNLYMVRPISSHIPSAPSTPQSANQFLFPGCLLSTGDVGDVLLQNPQTDRVWISVYERACYIHSTPPPPHRPLSSSPLPFLPSAKELNLTEQRELDSCCDPFKCPFLHLSQNPSCCETRRGLGGVG